MEAFILRSLSLTALAVLSAVTLAVPVGIATDGSFHHNGIMEAVYATYVVASSQVFEVELEVGDVLTATLSWLDSSMDFDLSILGPGGSCPVLPEPDVPCLTPALPPTIGTVCGETEPLLGSSPVTLTRTATTAGTHEVVVQTGFGVPLSTYTYELTATVNTGQGAGLFTGPFDTAFINVGTGCRALA